MNALRTATLAVAASGALLLAGCGQSDDSPDTPRPATESPRSSLSSAPGTESTGSPWTPETPEAPVDEATVQADYAPVVRDAVAVLAATPDWAQVEWSKVSTTVGEFGDLCVIAVGVEADQAPGTGPLDVVDILDPALASHGFDDTASANDPGGAALVAAHDDANALFEFRSKGSATIAVRVAAEPSQCR